VLIGADPDTVPSSHLQELFMRCYRVRIVLDPGRSAPRLKVVVKADTDDDPDLSPPWFRHTSALDGNAADCPACESMLEFQQPDTRRPHRLLAICHACDAWFLFDLESDLIVHLPTFDSRSEF
jgi:hypothetical protein